MTINQQLNRALLRLEKRAEGVDRDKLVTTFVDVGPLTTLLGSRDHQIVFGRRGTGKTHALLYVSEERTRERDVVVYLDLRRIGSTGGLYADPDISLSERATRLLADVLGAVHDELLTVFYERDDIDLGPIGTALDQFVTAATSVQVRGTITAERETEASESRDRGSSLGFEFSGTPALKLDDRSSQAASTKHRERQAVTGEARHRVHFGALSNALEKITASMAPHRIWLLLDEWSVVPIDLQPYLADLLRRAVFPVPGITVKIAAIEYRSAFYSPGERGDYIGIEPGADATADVNLDDFMVFDNDAQLATSFFLDLLFRHFEGAAISQHLIGAPQNAQEFLKVAFTQRTPFEELVTAAEGVPRDAINILALAAQRASTSPISIAHVRESAKAWYQRDKEAAVGASAQQKRLLYWIIDEVIAHRRARAFLLKSGSRHRLVDALFDARVLHVLKRSVSAQDQPGVRYDAYKVDYGCYVDLLTTQRSPQGLLPLDAPTQTAAYLEVPPDDYRAIRRAILDIAEFERTDAKGILSY